ncbi:Putative metallo-dependent phosphatase [Septoria linicola]|uniref:Metallo-dependent phosphatase n=1 Tax=Septoria linicola TaxID=215465 RepID=A0A9Q9AFL6_9PEZI|nr:putative metallo-dependent phosphatase [Septoria linicola]USW48157.1 Putative metallo-dependent phosphatase [Septoria linicola]
MAQQIPSQPRAYSQAYVPNGAPQPSGPVPGARPLDPNQGRVQQIGHARVLCIADVRGNLRQLNELAHSAKADYIIHTGDFGFYDDTSLDRIAEKTLKHVAQYSPLLNESVKADIARAGTQQSIKERFQRERLPLSELPQFLNKTYRLEVPVFTVWGACEDVSVLEKLRSQEYKIENLHVIDESHSRLLDVGGVKLRLLGLGGAVVMHKLFDNGEGRTTIAGGQGTMWTTLLQMGELIDTANRVYDPTETRVLVTHASPAREGLLNQLSVTLKADFSVSAGLHFRYGSSYNEFSVNPSLDHYRGKLSASRASFNDVWETVKHEVEPAVSENDAQHKLLQLALELVGKMPAVANGGNPFGGGPANGAVDESAFKNMWNFNLADAAFGWLVLDIDQGRIGTEMRAQGFNFSHRSGKGQQRPQGVAAAPANATMAPTSGNLPTPGQQPLGASQNRQPQGPQNPQPQTNLPQQPRSQQAPVPQPSQPAKPATPQSTSAANGNNGAAANVPSNDAPQVNGSSLAEPKPDTPSQAKQGHPQQSPQQPQEPSKGIFIQNVANINTADEVKSQLFAPEDAEKITTVDKAGQGRWVANFASSDVMQDVLKRGPTKDGADKNKGVRFAAYRARGTFGGAGGWGSARGGLNQRGGGEGRGGYQSAGGATTGSDSESGRARGGRGRGGFSRGGGRGRGRGKPEGAPAGADS